LFDVQNSMAQEREVSSRKRCAGRDGEQRVRVVLHGRVVGVLREQWQDKTRPRTKGQEIKGRKRVGIYAGTRRGAWPGVMNVSQWVLKSATGMIQQSMAFNDVQVRPNM
jgi:hypothetical protein